MALDPANFTDEQLFELTKASIIAAGSLATAYRLGGTALEPKDFEAAYDRALYAVTTGIERHFKRLSSV